MPKKDIRKTIIEASGQPYFENKTRELGYVTTCDLFNHVSDILKEIHYTHKMNKSNYMGMHSDKTMPFVLNCYDISKKVSNYEKESSATLGNRFVTNQCKKDMLKNLIDISIYAHLGIKLWFDKYGEEEE